jgi:hypothetical protein
VFPSGLLQHTRKPWRALQQVWGVLLLLLLLVVLLVARTPSHSSSRRGH